MPQPIIAQLVEPLRQDVLEISAQKLVAGDGDRTVAIRLAVLVAKSHTVTIDADDAAVGDGDAESIAGEIFERLRALVPWRDVDDPRAAPGAGRQIDIRAALGKGIADNTIPSPGSLRLFRHSLRRSRSVQRTVASGRLRKRNV
jgi:hypothetical protein